jgi:hypothetical protein
MGGMNTTELARDEILILQRFDFSLYVPLAEYAGFCKRVQTLAKEWNSKLRSMANLQEPTPYPQTPMLNTPVSNIPFFISSIENKFRKRGHDDEQTLSSMAYRRRSSVHLYVPTPLSMTVLSPPRS